MPQKYRDKAALVVALDASTPPGEYIDTDGKTVVGYQADLITAIGKALDVKLDLVNAGFETIIPGIVDGKYDIGQAGMYATAERMKNIDFVSYALIGSTLYTSGSSDKVYNGLGSLCGVSVAVQIGTTLQTNLQDQSKACQADGKPAVKILTFNSGSDEVLAVGSGRAQVGFDSADTVGYLVARSNGKYKTTGSLVVGNIPSSIAVLKGTGLDKAIQAGLKEIIADGTYAKILQKWGVSSIAIKDPKINDTGHPTA